MRRGRVQCVLSRASEALLIEGGPVEAVRKVGGCRVTVSGALVVRDWTYGGGVGRKAPGKSLGHAEGCVASSSA